MMKRGKEREKEKKERWGENAHSLSLSLSLSLYPINTHTDTFSYLRSGTRGTTVIGLRESGNATGRLLDSTHRLASVRLTLTTTDATRRSTHTTSDDGTTTDGVRVDGTRNTILHLEVKLGNNVHLVDGSLLNISLSSGLDHVTDDETLHSLVLIERKRDKGGKGERECEKHI